MLRLTITFALVVCILAASVGGEPTTIERFPFVAGLVSNQRLICPGALIFPNTVLVSVECLQNFPVSELQVRVGSSYDNSDGLLIPVSLVKIHENYDPIRQLNNVAIIKLAQPVTINAFIQPIELATEVPVSGTLAIVTGWAVNSFLLGSVPSVLQKADVTILNSRSCILSIFSWINSLSLNNVVCIALAVGGDSSQVSGPLVSGGKLVGITSTNNIYDYRGVYTSIPSLRPWIVATAASI